MSVYNIVFRAASVLVPSDMRSDWLAEWQAELWHVQCSETRFKTFCFALGTVQDAFWLQQNNSFPLLRKPIWMASPWWCISLLAILSAVSASVFHPLDALLKLPTHLWWAHLCLLLVAVGLLPATIPLYLGEFQTTRARRWIFLAIKIVLLTIIVFSVSLGAGAVQPHGALVGYILAFRWSLVDQRKRCPICLRLLTNPTRIGGAANTFLEWYGTELICRNGHGVLHVAEIRNSAYNPQRWLNLDSSWSGLFSARK